MNTQKDKDKELERLIKEFTGHAPQEREHKLVLLALAFILSILTVVGSVAFFLFREWLS
jgi:hypothetical protein